MSKRKNQGNGASQQTQPVASQQTSAAPQQETQYRVVAPKRPLTGTKHGGGTAATHHLLAAAAQKNGGTVSTTQARKIVTDAGDPGFFGYAVRRLRVLVPVVADAATQQPAA